MTVPASWESGSRVNVDPAVLTSLALACRDTERIRFGYTGADGTRTERNVEPHRLVLLSHRWYLVGYDLTRQGWRSFRLDRLRTVHGTGIRFRPRELPAADAADFVRAGIRNASAAYEVEAIIAASAQSVRERLGGWAAAEDIDDTSCRVRMAADSLDWAVIALGSAGADFQVVSPPELIDRVHDWGRRLSRASVTGRY